MSSVPLNRFDAIYGKTLDIEKLVSPAAYEDLLVNEKNKYRTKHYQLTRGAVGCYLSHMSLYKQLLDDPAHEYYLIFEDDAAILPYVYDRVALAVNMAPADWDMILFAPIMEVTSENLGMFVKYESFWGLCGYAINKKGAQRLFDEFNNRPITMQIDSKMSLMIMQDKLNVYGYKEKLIWHDHSVGTDIQMPVRAIKGINPFYIEDK